VTLSWVGEKIVIALGSLLGRNGGLRGPVVPCERRNALLGGSQSDRFAAGRFGPIAALLVSHDGFPSLLPRALHWAQIGSVTVISPTQDKV
jgi:hypothetical protein